MSGLDLFWYICWYTKYSGGYRTKSVSGPIIHRRYSTAACSSGRSVVPPLRLRGHREEPLDILVDGHDAQDPCGRQGVFRMHAVSPEDRPHAACATARGGSAPSPGVARSRRPPPRWRRSLTRPTRRSSQATHRTLGENKGFIKGSEGRQRPGGPAQRKATPCTQPTQRAFRPPQEGKESPCQALPTHSPETLTAK